MLAKSERLRRKIRYFQPRASQENQKGILTVFEEKNPRHGSLQSEDVKWLKIMLSGQNVEWIFTFPAFLLLLSAVISEGSEPHMQSKLVRKHSGKLKDLKPSQCYWITLGY